MRQGFELGEAITVWRDNLPDELRVEKIQHWDSSNIWALIICALSYRLECVVYRTIRQRARNTKPETMALANQKLLAAIFELDTILRRGMVHDVIQYCPPSMYECPSI